MDRRLLTLQAIVLILAEPGSFVGWRNAAFLDFYIDFLHFILLSYAVIFIISLPSASFGVVLLLLF